MAELYISILQTPPSMPTAAAYGSFGLHHGSPLSYSGSSMVKGYDPIGQRSMGSAARTLPDTVQKSLGIMEISKKLPGYGEISSPLGYARKSSVRPPSYKVNESIRKGEDIRPYFIH